MKAEEMRQTTWSGKKRSHPRQCAYELDEEVAELERCQTQFEAQCGGEA